MGTDFQIIDLHAHILPGLDDGPSTVDEALRMCELNVQQGVTVVVATPHMCDSRYPVTSEDVRNGVKELSAVCRERGLDLEILPGGDVRLEPELLDALNAGEVLTVADSGRYILLELPPQIVPRIEEIVFELEVLGVTPILSHPERNLDFLRRPKRLAELVDKGCLTQITGDSLIGIFGAAAKRTAERFLKSGLVHVVASDAHSARDRRPALGRVAQMLCSTVGEDMARKLLHTNPSKIIRGEPLNAPRGVLRRDKGAAALRTKIS